MIPIRRSAVLAIASVLIAHGVAEAAPGVPFLKGGTNRKVTLMVDNMGCAYEVEAKPVRLKKEKQGALGWRVENGCNIQRKALICVYDAQGKLAKPFEACTSVPPGIDLAVPFSLTATGGKAEIDCPAKTEGNYLALVLVGDEIKPAGCPATPPKEKVGAMGDRTFNHRLAVEIVP